jgi:hypothetical protein
MSVATYKQSKSGLQIGDVSVSYQSMVNADVETAKPGRYTLRIRYLSDSPRRILGRPTTGTATVTVPNLSEVEFRGLVRGLKTQKVALVNLTKSPL